MATTTKSTFLSLTLLLTFVAISSPKANALAINGVNVLGVVVAGTAHCSPTITSTCTTCAPLSNLRVALVLKGNELAAVNTAPDGTFRITINAPNIIAGLQDIDSLRIRVSVPIAGCPLWAQTSAGQLEGTPVLETGDNVVAGVANLVVPKLSLVS